MPAHMLGAAHVHAPPRPHPALSLSLSRARARALTRSCACARTQGDRVTTWLARCFKHPYSDHIPTIFRPHLQTRFFVYVAIELVFRSPSSAQFCAVLRSLFVAVSAVYAVCAPDPAVWRSLNMRPRGPPVLTPSCGSLGKNTSHQLQHQNVVETTTIHKG